MSVTHPGSRTTHPLRVLVVDDNVEGAEMVCALLETLGCVTAVAFDGLQGLAAAVDFDPDLALIDLEMPGMDGCEVARRIRTDTDHRPVKLVCMTGRGQPDVWRRCLAAGFDESFLKPMLPKSLLALVAAAAHER